MANKKKQTTRLISGKREQKGSKKEQKSRLISGKRETQTCVSKGNLGFNFMKIFLGATRIIEMFELVFFSKHFLRLTLSDGDHERNCGFGRVCCKQASY